MPVHIIECEQGSPTWFAARAGIPTASNFKTIIGVKKDPKEKLTRQKYMRELAGEVITGEPAESFNNVHMDRGRAMEDEARDRYAFLHGVDPVRVGFLRNGDTGASPDSLIGADGGAEIKTKLPHLMIDVLLKDEAPGEFMAQVQGNIWVAERNWWDLVIYWPKLPLFVKRIYRDDAYCQMLEREVAAFNTELADLVDRVKRYAEAA